MADDRRNPEEPRVFLSFLTIDRRGDLRKIILRSSVVISSFSLVSFPFFFCFDFTDDRKEIVVVCFIFDNRPSGRPQKRTLNEFQRMTLQQNSERIPTLPYFILLSFQFPFLSLFFSSLSLSFISSSFFFSFYRRSSREICINVSVRTARATSVPYAMTVSRISRVIKALRSRTRVNSDLVLGTPLN